MLLLALALLLAGVLAPFISAASFSAGIRDALEFSLGRKVQFERVYFTIFSGPGFSLENVTIAEDGHYGVEPFAYVPTLQASLRLDKLLRGEIRFASVRLVAPSLNLVKASDGTWNVVQLIARLSAPRRLPLNLLPTFEVSDGRINFKLGSRKTTLYISESELSVYPVRSGKVNMRFSGSPSRSDRAGAGFGHFRGRLNWYPGSSGTVPDRVEGQITLDPSNLSELTTLVEGNDVGVHGTIRSTVQVVGPATALSIDGELQLNDVHRWDLIPSRGEAWPIHFRGNLDLFAHHLDIRTVPAKEGQVTPVALHLSAVNFLAYPACSVVAELKDAPLADLLPLASRMGIVLPNGASLRGALSGAIGYSSHSGWAGGITVRDAEAVLMNAPTLRAARSDATVSGKRVHFAPTTVQAGENESFQMNGDYSFSSQQTDVSLSTVEFPAGDLKSITTAWFGSIPALAAVSSGNVTGQVSYSHSAAALNTAGNHVPISLSGHFDLSDATLDVPGIATPLRSSRGHMEFENGSVGLDRLTANLGERTLRASYRYDPLGEHSENVHLEVSAADVSELESVLAPALSSNNIWTRLRIRTPALPSWLTSRDLEADVVVHRLVFQDRTLGSLSTHLLWQGSDVKLSNLSLKVLQGQISGSGTVDLSSNLPHWRFSTRVSRFPWSGGFLSAEAQVTTSGTHDAFLRNLEGEGAFSGRDLAFSPGDRFQSVRGPFKFSFVNGWPDLQIPNLAAVGKGDEWSGDARTRHDGQVLLNLVRAGQQMHFVSSLSGDNTIPSDPASPREPSRQ